MVCFKFNQSVSFRKIILLFFNISKNLLGKGKGIVNINNKGDMKK